MAIKAWGPLFALVGMVARISTGLVIEHSKPHDQAQPAQANSSNKEARKAAADLSGQEHSKERNKKTYWYDPFLDHLTDWLLVLFNGVLAAFTVRLFYAAAEQSRDMKASIAAAERAAASAEASVELTRKAFIAEHRAWLNWTANRTAWFEQSEGDDKFWLGLTGSFKNVGKTPALNINYAAKVYDDPEKRGEVTVGVAFFDERMKVAPSGHSLATLRKEDEGPISMATPATAGKILRTDCQLWLSFHASYRLAVEPSLVAEIGAIYKIDLVGQEHTMMTQQGTKRREVAVTLTEWTGARRLT